MNIKICLVECFILISLISLSSCKKEQTQQVTSYESVKEQIVKLEKEYANRAVTMSVFPSSNSWTSSSSIPIPALTKFYYCYSTLSPLGSPYVRFNYQIEVDAATKNYLCANRTTKRLEFRFATQYSEPGSTGGWKYYTRSGFSACADWPRCFFVDYDVSGPLAIPDLVVASIVDISGSSNYSTSWMSFVGWDGSFTFTTPPTFSISKGYQMDIYPGPAPTPCP